jgi:hypothetical protein
MAGGVQLYRLSPVKTDGILNTAQTSNIGSRQQVKVNCRAGAGLDEPAHYALAVTLEVADELRVPVYQEVSERINLQTAIRATAWVGGWSSSVTKPAPENA